MKVMFVDGRGWSVVSDSGTTHAGPFETNAEAWKALDRMSGEVVNKSESRSEWSFNKSASGE